MDQKRLIILAGAPRVHELSWDDETLNWDLQTPIKRFLGEQGRTTASQPSQLSTTIDLLPKWRSVSFDLFDPMGRDDANDEGLQHAARFLYSEEENLATEAVGQERLQFLEHSLALINELESSNIAGPGDSTLSSSANSIAATSFSLTTNSSFSASSASKLSTNVIPDLNLTGEVTDLKRIPNAAHIARIHPQTVTVNVIAAVISIAPPRTVKLRKRPGNEVEIVELLLGDETRAAFSVSFWLIPAESQQKPAADLREALKVLGTGDVVLIQHVALNVWKGCVYGQSLSRRFARNSTALDVLNNAHNLPTAMKAKLNRVQGWKDNFIGAKSNPPKTLGVEREDELPPDTQALGES